MRHWPLRSGSNFCSKSHLPDVCEAACHFNVPKTTLQECINGQRSIISSNAEKSWLNDHESQVIVNALIHSAQQGFPDTKYYLHGHVNTVIQEKLGDPSFHVGENWVDWWRGGESGFQPIGEPLWTQFMQGH